MLLSLDHSIKNGLCSSDPNEKPPHSYIAMISMSILSTADKKILLNDIYQYIMDTFPYYNNKEKAWRNSIRHNLSLNECFVKSGRSDNGKGNYWAIHPACVDDFSKGDFRRRQARRRARKSSAKSATGSPEDGPRFNLGYVPMTSSKIGFHPYSMNNHHPRHVHQHNPYQIFPTPGSTFGTTGKSYPATMQPLTNDASFSAAASIGMLSSINSPPSFCSSSPFGTSSNPSFYTSCQLQRAFTNWAN